MVIKPGDASYALVSLPLDVQLASYLAPLWDSVEDTYVRAAKIAFSQIRIERDSVFHFASKTARLFQDFLVRPDHKQMFVTRWQSDFNEIADDMRADDVTKAELFNRMEDLKESLWDITDKRRADAEKEKQSIVNDLWLEDHMGTMCNLYTTLLQAEVDRQADTERLVDDYYCGMQRLPLTEPSGRGLQLQLMDLSLPPVDVSATGETPVEPEKKGGVVKVVISRSFS